MFVIELFSQIDPSFVFCTSPSVNDHNFFASHLELRVNQFGLAGHANVDCIVSKEPTGSKSAMEIGCASYISRPGLDSGATTEMASPEGFRDQSWRYITALFFQCAPSQNPHITMPSTEGWLNSVV